MFQFIKESKAGMTIAVLAIALLGGSMALEGCSVANRVMVDVPPAVSAATGAPDRVTYNDAQYVFEKWMAIQRSDTAQFIDSIEQGQATVAFFDSLIATGLNALAPVVENGSFGGTALLAVGGIAGLAGLFTKRPGDALREEVRVNEVKAAFKE